jgi:hypothetical protein
MDEGRNRFLIAHGEKLGKPENEIRTRQEILNWSKLNNQFEAYFLEKYFVTPHSTAELSNEILWGKKEE